MIVATTILDELPLDRGLILRLRASGLRTLLDLARARHSLPELTPAEQGAILRLLRRPDVRARMRTVIA